MFELVESRKNIEITSIKTIAICYRAWCDSSGRSNGAGKTTLFNILTGRIFPTCGTVFIITCGEDWKLGYYSAPFFT